MASFRKLNGKWQVQVNKSGVRKAARFTTKAEAEVWAHNLEKSIGQGLNPAKFTKTMQDVFDLYSEKVSKFKRTHKREVARLAHLARTEIFGKALGDYLVVDVVPAVLSEWRTVRLSQVKPGTVLREWTLLTHVFNTAANEWQIIQSNPLKSVKRPKKPAPRNRLITDHEIDVMCYVSGYTKTEYPATATARTVAIMLFAIETGMRLKEMTRLYWAGVDFKKRIVHVTEDSKTGRREVALTPRAVEILKQMKKGETPLVFDLTESQVDSLFRKLRIKAGLSGFTFHDTKHLACTRLAKRMSAFALARMLGTRDLKTLSIYFNESAEELSASLHSAM